MKRKPSKVKDWKKGLSPKYLEKIEAIREEFGCSFEKAEDIFVENILKERK